jgi:hypothetical protein
VHYFGGTFTGRPLWSWTAASSTFRPVGSFGLGELTKHLTVVASGSTLYLGGSFTTLDGVSGASRLAKVAVGSSSAGAALSLAGGTPLSPGFSAGTTSYTASVPEGTCTETVSFDAADGSASVTYTVDGGATKLWPASDGVSVLLKKGTGITLAVTVRAADVSSSTTYSLVVTRQGTATNPGASTGSESVGVTSATVPVTITPNGHSASSLLRWGTSTGNYTSSASAPFVACDAAPTSADVTMNGLSASTTYFYVLEVTRSVDSAVVTSAEKSFTTEPGAYVAVSSVSSITVSSATLNLNLNALGTWDNYQVHLSADLSYGTCLLPPRWFGDSQCVKTFANQGTSNPETTSVTASGLSAATTYNYRVRVPDCCGGAKRTVTGTFTTSAAPASSVVPASSVPSSTTAGTTAPTQSRVANGSSTSTGSLPVLKIGKTASKTTLLSLAKLTAPSGSKYAVKATPTTVCKVLGLGVKGVKKGTCRVTVTVTPKGKKATSKTVSLAVS